MQVDTNPVMISSVALVFFGDVEQVGVHTGYS